VSDPPLGWSFPSADRRQRLSRAFAAIDQLLAEHPQVKAAPAAAFFLVIDGEVAHEKLLGVQDLEHKRPITRDSELRIASITKTFTATLLLKLRDQGKLELDVPARRYLPELGGVRRATADSPEISLRHLLTHSAGLPRGGSYTTNDPKHVPTERDVLSGLEGLSPTHAPGLSYSYSNFGFSVLGILAGRVSGDGYRRALRKSLLEPLGMGSTHFEEGEVPAARLVRSYPEKGDRPLPFEREGAAEADGGLWLSVADMQRWVKFQLSAWPPRNDPDSGPVSRATLREMQLASTSLGVRRQDPGKQSKIVVARSVGAGLGWGVTDNCYESQVVSHDGLIDGFSSFVMLLPQYGVGLFLVTSRPADVRGVLNEAVAKLRESGGLERRALQPAPELKRALASLIRLASRFDDAEYAKLFTPEIKLAVPKQKLSEDLEKVKDRLGECKGQPEAVEVSSATQTRFRIACDKGSWDLTLGYNPILKAIGSYNWSLDATPTGVTPPDTPCRAP
jgi:CubicO group peptidase (beta-lactamase class C family)